MNTFGENPLFLFVDELADDLPNFATDGKIVELFDTGCDARTPGAAFKFAKKPDTTAQSSVSTQNNIPNVRKPFNLTRRQDETPVKKNTSSVTGTCKLPKQSKLMRWNYKPKDEVATKSNEAEVKVGLDSVLGNQRDGKGSEYSKLVGFSPEQQKATLNPTRTWMSSKYCEKNRTVKSQPISSSIPKQYKVPGAKSRICSSFEGRAKTSPTKSVTNSRMTSSMKTSKVTSEASLNYGVRRVVNRAVDKDSLSNCSRQLETAKICGGPSFSKTGYASRLPRSAGAVKSRPTSKTHSESPLMIKTGKGTEIKRESKTDLIKIVGGTDHELQDKRLQTTTTRITSSANSWKRKGRLEGETTSKLSLPASSMLISQRKHGDDVAENLSTKTHDVDDRNTTTLSSSRSKMTVSKVPVPRFGKNLLAGNKSVQRPGNPDKLNKVDLMTDGREPRSNERLPSKIAETDTPQFRESENKILASESPATYLEKVTVRPSAKCHDITPREREAKNTTSSYQTKLSKPRTSSIVPKLMDEFRLEEKKHSEASRCSPRSLAVPSVSPEVKIANEKLKTEQNGGPSRTSGILSDQLNERLSRFSDRVQEVLSFKAPSLSGVTECKRSGHRSVDRGEESKSNVDAESVSLSGIKAVKENDEEIELKTIFEDTSAIGSRKPRSESSKSHLRAGKAKESKLRHSSLCPSTTGPKVPHPVVMKRIPRKEMTRNSLARTSAKKQELSIPRGVTKNSAKTDVKTEAKPSTPPAKKSVEHIPESRNVPKTTVVANGDEDEEVIPIMNPALYNIRSLATHYRNRGKPENTVLQDTVHGVKLKSWIEGHEQAYLKGRAIGLKVASMARAAKENLKHEFVRSGLKSTTPVSLPDKSQEIVDIGVSVIEKVLAEKGNKIHSPSVRGDQVLNYSDFYKKTPSGTVGNSL